MVNAVSMVLYSCSELHGIVFVVLNRARIQRVYFLRWRKSTVITYQLPFMCLIGIYHNSVDLQVMYSCIMLCGYNISFSTHDVVSSFV